MTLEWRNPNPPRLERQSVTRLPEVFSDVRAYALGNGQRFILQSNKNANVVTYLNKIVADCNATVDKVLAMYLL